jgi:hypothetical protein
MVASMRWGRATPLGVVGSGLMALGLGASCESSTEVVAPQVVDMGVVPGTRLRPVVAVLDGAAAFVRWHDTEVGVDCSFMHDEAGRWRCLPTGANVVFRDAACTEAVLLSRCGEAFAYGTMGIDAAWDDFCDPEQSASEAWRRPYRATGFPAPATHYYSGHVTAGQVTCNDAPSPLPDGAELTPASPIPADEFVEATAVVEHGATRLGRRKLVAADGAEEILTGFDNELDVPCEWHPSLEDSCTPHFYAVLNDGLYADETCTTPAASEPCGQRGVVYEQVDECEVRFRAGGELVDNAYRSDGATCAPSSAEGPFFRVGEVLPPGALPALELIRAGEGRLQTTLHADPSGRAVLFDYWPLHDTELAVPCEPLDLGDPFGIRCIPLLSRIDTDEVFFSDPNCSVVVSVQSDPSCSDAPLHTLMHVSDAQCDPNTWDVRTVTTERVTSTWTLQDGACVAAPLPEGKEAYAFGPRYPADRFAPVTLEVR